MHPAPIRILHVEDVPEEAELVQHALATEKVPFEILRVDNRTEYVAALERGGFDIILSDFSLPSFDGDEALELWKNLLPDIPFVFVSGTIGEEHAVEMVKKGATDYVLKQRLTLLPRAVRRALEEASERAALRRSEEALRTIRERFELIARATTDLVWDWDIRADQIWCNEGVRALFGYPREKAERDREWWNQCIHPEDRHEVVSSIRAVLDGGGRFWSADYRFRRADGSYAPVADHGFVMRDDAGRPARMVGSMVDITERRRSEETLREQAELLDKAQDAILVRDLDGQIRFWNQGAERIYGWNASEVRTPEVARVLFKSEAPAVREARRRTVERGEWSGELVNVHKGGAEVIVESRWSLLLDEAGKPKSVLVIDTDVTEKKKLQAQFLRAQRMESLGALAGGIAHDLNNVLSPILMAIEVLKPEQATERGLKVLTTIEASARRGAEIVKQVLTFARGLEEGRVSLPAAPIIAEIEKIIRETFPKTIEIRSEVPDTLWQVTGDATQLHQVLLNLCVNARDAMPDGGDLILLAGNVFLSEREAKANRDARPGPYVALTVRDTGSGIPKEVIEKVFDPFFTTKEVGKGTGLGLFTSLAIVKAHGGFLEVASEVGRGTTFTIYLPAANGGAEARVEEARPDPPAGRGELILVVDDEVAIREITRETLEFYGYRVLTASNGNEAVALFTKSGREIAAVITDMTMPLMDGPAMIRALRKIDPEVKVITTTGLVETGKSDELERGVVRAMLHKPYTAEQLLTTMKNVLDDEMVARPAGR